MTAVEVVPDPRATLQRLLCDARLRRVVASIVRRRVAASDVEDVVQTVYCDALAAPRLPVASELPAWLVGIARHKVSDYLRAKTREGRLVDVDDVEPAREPAPFEARDLLARVLDETAGESRARETLSWLLREHEGEPLATIAANDHVSAVAVRQRVSRMRRALRARWVAALALLLVAGAGVRHFTRERPALIVADTFAPVAATAARGSWTLTFVELGPDVDAAPRAELLAEAVRAHVDVTGDRVVVSTAARRREYAMTLEARGTEAHAHLVGVDGKTAELTLRFPTADRVVVDVAGPHGARLVLERDAR